MLEPILNDSAKKMCLCFNVKCQVRCVKYLQGCTVPSYVYFRADMETHCVLTCGNPTSDISFKMHALEHCYLS